MRLAVTYYLNVNYQTICQLMAPSRRIHNPSGSSRQRPLSSKGQPDRYVFGTQLVLKFLRLRPQDNDGDQNEKHQFEDEAEESSIEDFIDDEEEEPDESDADAQEMTRATCDALRNRRNWKEAEFQCPLCADLRVVLRHLLRHK